MSDLRDELHRKMYPNGVPREKLSWAITQAHNSVMGNRARSQAEKGRRQGDVTYTTDSEGSAARR